VKEESEYKTNASVRAHTKANKSRSRKNAK